MRQLIPHIRHAILHLCELQIRTLTFTSEKRATSMAPRAPVKPQSPKLRHDGRRQSLVAQPLTDSTRASAPVLCARSPQQCWPARTTTAAATCRCWTRCGTWRGGPISALQCFEVLGKIGEGSYAEAGLRNMHTRSIRQVFKVRSKDDGLLYAVKRSKRRFRGENDKCSTRLWRPA